MSNIIVVNKYGKRDKKKREDIYLDLTLKNKKIFFSKCMRSHRTNHERNSTMHP